MRSHARIRHLLVLGECFCERPAHPGMTAVSLGTILKTKDEPRLG